MANKSTVVTVALVMSIPPVAGLNDNSASKLDDDERHPPERFFIDERTLDKNILANLSPNNVARAVAPSMITRFGPSVARLPPNGRILRRPLGGVACANSLWSSQCTIL
jgi:hypothetical protein